MALSFEQLIADVKGFSDGTEIPVTIGSGDTATTERLRLGDIRGQLSNTLARYEAAHQQDTDRISALEQTLKALNDAKEQAKAAAEVAKSTTEVSRETSNGNGHTNGNTGAAAGREAVSVDDLMADPWSRALRSTIENEYNERLSSARDELSQRFETALKSIKDEHNQFVDTSKKGVGALTSLLLNLKAQNDFNALKDWPADYDPARAFKEAGDKGYIDKATGLPDLARLHHDVTEDARIEARAKALAEKMFEQDKKARTEQNQSMFNRSTAPNAVRAKPKAQEKSYKNLQEYMMSDEALPTDEEMAAANALFGRFNMTR